MMNLTKVETMYMTRMSSVRSSLSPLYEAKEEDGSKESSGRSTKRSRFNGSLNIYLRREVGMMKDLYLAAIVQAP